MMTELGFGQLFDRKPLFVDNTGALHIAGESKYLGQLMHETHRSTVLLIQELVKKERINIHQVVT